MDPAVKQAIYDAVRKEPFARTMNMQLVALELGYDIRVTDNDGRLIATCQALAYRTGKPIPFL